MVVKRTFTTKLEPVDAFGLANELLRPRGFTLDKGNPPRFQAWRRGVEAGKKARSIFQASQDIQVEFERGRVNVTATAGVVGRKAIHAQRMLTGYAESLERLMASGEAPNIAARSARRAEGGIRRAIFRRQVSVCIIIVGLAVGAGYIAMTNPSLATKWFSSGKNAVAESKSKKSGAPPVVVVRRAGVQSDATPRTAPEP